MHTPPSPSDSLTNTPLANGFRMPAEWESHEATWLSWPHNTTTWPNERLERVQASYLLMIEALIPNEKVHLLVRDQEEEDAVVHLLTVKQIEPKNFFTHKVRTVDVWIRDYGPTFLKKQNEKAWCKFIFNAWGGKYEDLAQDTHVFEKHSSLIHHPKFKVDRILEGGSIDVNGQGSLLTTEQCLFHPDRNREFGPLEVEQFLKEHLGINHIVWLEEGIIGDDTDGHIDDVARFANPNTILAAYEENESDENHPILKKNWERLERSLDQNGNPWNLVKVPMPGPLIDDDIRLPASYVNFYIANGVVLVPTFEDPNDERALEIIGKHFPDRDIISIPSRELVYGLGSIHCITQQEPL